MAAADEALVPLLRLAPPTETDIREHGVGLASHIVFGLSLDFLRRHINSAISAPVVRKQALSLL